MMAMNVKAFWDDERGAEMVEWAVVAAILLISSTIYLLWVQDDFLIVVKETFMKMQRPYKVGY
jgi:hypothetical protein